MKDKILILGATRYILQLILKVKEMGFLAYVVTNRPDDVGVTYSDKFINSSILDTDELVALISREKINLLLLPLLI